MLQPCYYQEVFPKCTKMPIYINVQITTINGTGLQKYILKADRTKCMAKMNIKASVAREMRSTVSNELIQV